VTPSGWRFRWSTTSWTSPTDTAIQLGKTAGKDAAADKPTYVSVLGLERSRDYVQELYAQALAALDASGLDAPSTRALRALAGVVVHRDK
jgi:farnesyl diphosphate synthase